MTLKITIIIIINLKKFLPYGNKKRKQGFGVCKE